MPISTLVVPSATFCFVDGCGVAVASTLASGIFLSFQLRLGFIKGRVFLARPGCLWINRGKEFCRNLDRCLCGVEPVALHDVVRRPPAGHHRGYRVTPHRGEAGPYREPRRQLTPGSVDERCV